MSKLFILYNFFINSVYLLKSPLQTKAKLQIFIQYVVVTVQCFISDIKKLKVGQYELIAFDKYSLQYLFGEIFVKNTYYFQTDRIKPIIIDCGSNIGASILYFKYLYPEAEIYGFEPDPTTFRLLEFNIRNNKLKGVHIFNSAISDRSSKLNFYVDESPGNLTMSAIKGRLGVKKIVIKQQSIGNFISQNLSNSNISLLKMDIEGYETLAIQDLIASNKIENIAEAIIEYHLNIPGNKSSLGNFLNSFEANQFDYLIQTDPFPHFSIGSYQDVVLHFYKKNPS